jgi:hypothetical protein
VHEELSNAKERNLQLSVRLQQKDLDLTEIRAQLEASAKRGEELRKQCIALEEEGDRSLKKHLKETTPPVMRLAEKRRLQKISDEKGAEGCGAGRRTVIGADMLVSVRDRQYKFQKTATPYLQVTNTVLAQHLVQDIREKSSIQEFSDGLFSSELLEGKLHEFEMEMERLSSKIEHLRSQNDVLSLTLQESKDSCDNLTVLIGIVIDATPYIIPVIFPRLTQANTSLTTPHSSLSSATQDTSSTHWRFS